MSFILKALQKSQLERERRSPETSPVRLEFGAARSEKRAWWPWALVPAVLANLALAGYLLWPASEVEVARQTGPTPDLTAAPKLPEPPQPAETPVPAVGTPAPEPETSQDLQAAPASAAAPLQAEEAPARPSEASRPSGETSAPDRVAALPLPEPSRPSQPLAEQPLPNPAVPSPARPTDPGVDPGDDPGPAPDAVRAAAPGESPGENLVAQRVADSPSAPLPRRKPALPPPPLPDPAAPPPLDPRVVEELAWVVEDLARMAIPAVPSETAAAGGTPPDGPKEPEADPAGVTHLTLRSSVPSLRDLPPAFRDSLPALWISIHVYNTNPRARMVRINRRKLREGERTESGLQVDEITPTGLIVTYKDTQFSMPISDTQFGMPIQ